MTGIAGTYSCSDNNLAIATDGTIDLDASNPGTYTVTHTLTNCPGTATQEVFVMYGNNCNTYSYGTEPEDANGNEMVTL